MNLSEETAFLLFIQAQFIVKLPKEIQLCCFEDKDCEAKADMLGLVIAMALMCCNVDRETGQRDVVGYVKENLSKFYKFCILFFYKQLGFKLEKKT